MIDQAARYHCLSPERIQAINNKKQTVEEWVHMLEQTPCEPGITFGDALRRSQNQEPRPTVDLPAAFLTLPDAVREEVLYRICYQGYLEREQKVIERTQLLDAIKIPADFDYTTIVSLRNESRQKLIAVRPLTLGQASRISGVNPSDIQVLMVAVKSKRAKES